MSRQTSKIIKIKKNKEGDITDVMLENEIVVPINHAILMAKEGRIDGTIVVRGKDGGEFLRNDPNSDTIDAISALPTFQ
ncbi:DUF3892 domain-containing protein [Clostridium aminobutyricum]|uniref:DUF3892 domain-containing protein n=1 Tax=Clostridium aminobutyricum TaxID=33953 RepID=A0A939D5Q9_CLOAM|nr:DUF3892 domain-containing protein [Clostridium aminobutyricum]MBN7771819.1 DUF3892 domain-containing protein [Clostridium aminobutyricum]